MSEELNVLYYKCPTHPRVESDKPGTCTLKVEEKYRCGTCQKPSPLAQVGPEGLIHKGCGGEIVTTPVLCGRPLQAVIVTIGEE